MGTETLALESRVEAGRDVYRFHTADGVVSPDAFRETELALLGAVVPDPDDDLLVVDANYGVVGTVLADLAPDGRIRLAETSARAARLCERNLAENGVGNAAVTLGPDLESVEGEFDRAAFAPRPYDPVAVVRERICGALARLREGGTLAVAARNHEGAARYRETMAELGDDVETAAKSGDVRVYRCTKGPGFEPREYVAERTFAAAVRGVECSFVTRPGLFSAGHLDAGTRHLIEELPLADGDDVLDLACGYGPIGIFAARLADCDVWLADDDAVATAYARRNAARNDVAPAAVVTADGVEGVRDGSFDLVAANPPTHAGEGVVRDLFAGVADVLAPGGRFALVYNDVLDYEAPLRARFDSVRVARNADGFDVTVAEP